VSFIFRIVIFVVHYCTHLPFYLEVNFHFPYQLQNILREEMVYSE